MAKKIPIRQVTCAECRNGTLIETRPGNPRVVQCKVYGRRFVADSPRYCKKGE